MRNVTKYGIVRSRKHIVCQRIYTPISKNVILEKGNSTTERNHGYFYIYIFSPIMFLEIGVRLKKAKTHCGTNNMNVNLEVLRKLKSPGGSTSLVD